MGHHFREQDTHAKFSRRLALQGMFSAGLVGTLPIASEAAAAPSDDDVIAECVERLRQALARKFPIVNKVRYHLSQETDGTFRLSIQGTRTFEPYTGPGLYEISLGGYVMTFWIERHVRRNIRTGEPMPFGEYFVAHHWYEGQFVDDMREWSMVNIVRKLSGEMPA